MREQDSWTWTYREGTETAILMAFDSEFERRTVYILDVRICVCVSISLVIVTLRAHTILSH